MNVKPMFNRVFIKLIKDAEESSILLTPFSTYTNRGRIINAGDSSVVKKDDIVIFDVRASRDITIEGEEYISVDEADIFAIIEE